MGIHEHDGERLAVDEDYDGWPYGQLHRRERNYGDGDVPKLHRTKRQRLVDMGGHKRVPPSKHAVNARGA